MKKIFRKYLGIWAILLALFNVIAFVSVGWIGYEKYTPSFWIGYVGITVMFAGQLACAWKVFREENLQKVFYNISIFRISYHGLIWSFVIGGACMLISPLPYWVGAILCAIVLVATAMAAIKASAAVELVGEIDEKIKMKTGFIKSLTADAEGLIDRANGESAKAACKKVYEAARYSDPMSHDALAPIEEQITEKFAALADAVAKDDIQQIIPLAEEVVHLLEERARKCRLLK